MTPDNGTEPMDAAVPSPSAAPGRKRLHGLSVRMLMLLVLAVGGSVGWVCLRARMQREAVAAIRAAGGYVIFDWEYDSPTLGPKAGSPSPRWLRRHLGPGFFEEVADVRVFSGVGDVLMVSISRFPHLERLSILATGVTDANLAHVAGLTHLKELDIAASRGVTNRGLHHLRYLRKLKFLMLWGCSVTDLEPIKHLSRLESLDLGQTQVDDAGLAPVENFQALKILSLSEPRITDLGMAHLRGLLGLVNLRLEGTRITDEGLRSLSGLSRLEVLSLKETRITDNGLAHLTGLRNCKEVRVRGTRVTPEGIAAMKMKCPWMNIIL